MTAYVGASIQFQTHSVTDLLPDASRRYRGLRKKRSTGVRLRLETQDTPDPGPPRIGQKPAHDVWDRSNVPLGHGAVVCELQWRADALTDIPRQVRERLAHGVKVALALNAADGITMFSVQAEECAPIVRAFQAGAEHAEEFPNAQTCASGLRVPKAVGDFLMLKILRASKGGAVSVEDEEMIRMTREVGRREGIFVAPEGAACFAALRMLLSSGQISPDDQVVTFNTGSGIKYLECYEPGG